jgi:hypothetical protein
MNTHVLFWSPHVAVHTDPAGQYSVRATQDLATGTLVLLEHILVGDGAYILEAIRFKTSLFRTLYPRDPLGDQAVLSASSQPLDDAAERKLRLNAFSFFGETVLGDAFSKFNHSCTPNCHMDIADKVAIPFGKKSVLRVHVYGMWTHRTVPAGGELTIDYVNGADQHEACKAQYGFECACQPAQIGRAPQRAEVHRELGRVFRTRDRHLTLPTVDAYLRTAQAADVITAQELARRGFHEFGAKVVVTVAPDEHHPDGVARVKKAVRAALLQWRAQCPAQRPAR